MQNYSVSIGGIWMGSYAATCQTAAITACLRDYGSSEYSYEGVFWPVAVLIE